MIKFLKKFVFNLILIGICVVAMYAWNPEFMAQVFGFMGGLLGPGLIFLMLVVAALPGRRR
jgi:hypothetical protein